MGIISVPNTFSPDTTAKSSEVNANFSTVFNEVNGNISAANLANDAVTTAKIASGAVTASELGSGAVTSAKISGIDKSLTTTDYNPYKFSVYLSNAFSSNSGGVSTKVPFNAEDYDTNNNFDSATNYRYTSSIAGFYHIDAAVKTNVIGATRRVIIALYKNGSEFTQGDDNTRNDQYIGAGLSLDIQLAASDYLEIFVFTSDGQAFDNTGRRCRFSGHLFSRT